MTDPLSAHSCAIEAKRCRELAANPRLPSHSLLLIAMAETWEGMAEDLQRVDNLGLVQHLRPKG